MPLLYSVALFTGCHPEGGQPLAEKPESFKIVDYLLNSWNQIITELRQWQELKQGFSLAI